MASAQPISGKSSFTVSVPGCRVLHSVRLGSFVKLMQRFAIFIHILIAVLATTSWPAERAMALVPRETSPPDYFQPGVVVAPPAVELPSKEKIKSLSDDDLLSFFKKDFDKKEVSGKIVFLGLHRKMPLIVWYQCSDVCPQMTTRYIYYQLPENTACATAGGFERRGRTAWPEETETLFCVPGVLQVMPAGVASQKCSKHHPDIVLEGVLRRKGMLQEEPQAAMQFFYELELHTPLCGLKSVTFSKTEPMACLEGDQASLKGELWLGSETISLPLFDLKEVVSCKSVNGVRSEDVPF